MGKLIRRPSFWVIGAAVLAAVAVGAVTLFSGGVVITAAELAKERQKLPVPAALDEPLAEGEGFVPAAENERFRLDWDGERQLFRVVSKATGAVWDSGCGFDRLESYSKRNRRVMTALLQLNYLNEEGTESAQNNTVSGVEVTASRLQAGIALHFDFTEPQIALTVQLWLDEYGLALRIPPEEIVESGKCRLLSADVLPAFGSRMTGDNGFLLFPDGSGALMDCRAAGKTAGVYAKAVYADRYADLQEVADTYADGETGVTVPYFGSAQNGGAGYIAYIESGAENARISLSVGGEALPLNRLYPTVLYRFSRALTNSQGVTAIAFSAGREAVDCRVRYLLLEPERATYSDMAVTLRRFLQENGTLPKAAAAADAVPVTVEWLITVRRNELLRAGDLVMTSFDGVDAALTALEDAGVKNTRSLLLGWQKEGVGVYPQSVSPSGSAGGKTGLSRLLATAGGGREFYLETDYVQANGEGRFNKRQDAVTDFMHTVVSDSTATLFLRNPLRAYDRLVQTDLARFRSLGAAGLAFNSFSRFLPADCAEQRRATAADAANAYAAMLRQTQAQGVKTAVQTGAAYLLSRADYCYDTFDLTSGSPLFTAEIPFYQMLLHGLIPYSGTTPGNMSADLTETKLRWAEYGCVPYFLLSAESSDRLKNALVSDMFNTRFSDWCDRVAEIGSEFNDRLRPLYGQEILRHERAGDVAYVTYANGAVLAVNYGETAAHTPGGAVPARDYAVFEGGEKP